MKGRFEACSSPDILQTRPHPGLEVEGKDLIVEALSWYVGTNVDFIDAYNTAWMEAREITSTASGKLIKA